MEELEREALRAVYDAARGVLRWNGVDSEKLAHYMEWLATSIEQVKIFDSGLYEED